ncbi:MAG: hypothetical protein U0841_10770 [Chloroflexia bacterium]
MPAHFAEDPGVVQDLRADPASFADDGEEEVFSAHEAVATARISSRARPRTLRSAPGVVALDGDRRIGLRGWLVGRRRCVDLADRCPRVGEGETEAGECLGGESTDAERSRVFRVPMKPMD